VGAERLARRAPNVGIGRRITIRVRAEGAADAVRAWREVDRAMALDRAQVYVDGQDGLPLLGGPLGSSPDRAYALLRAFGSGRRFVATDRTYASVRVKRPRQARVRAERARAAGIKRLEISWPAGAASLSWFDAAGIDRDAVTLDDDPATVLTLLDAVDRAEDAGFNAIAWERRGETPTLRLTRPHWLDEEIDLSIDASTLRRLVRAIRSIDWPGVAHFRVSLGPGACPNAVAGVSVAATSHGRLRDLDAAACTSPAHRAAFEQAWDDAAH
jgi:hypothetical protein